MEKEKNFENRIRAFLKTLPNEWHFKHWGGGYAKAGIPDLIGCINGKFVAIEVKASDGKLSPLQVRTLNKITCAGGYAVAVYPEQFNELKENLISISKGEI